MTGTFTFLQHSKRIPCENFRFCFALNVTQWAIKTWSNSTMPQGQPLVSPQCQGASIGGGRLPRWLPSSLSVEWPLLGANLHHPQIGGLLKRDREVNFLSIAWKTIFRTLFCNFSDRCFSCCIFTTLENAFMQYEW